MPVLSMILLLLFLGVVFPLRSIIRKLRFGSADRASYDRTRPLVWWVADLLFLLGFGLVVFGPFAQIVGLSDLPIVFIGTTGSKSGSSGSTTECQSLYRWTLVSAASQSGNRCPSRKQFT